MRITSRSSNQACSLIFDDVTQLLAHPGFHNIVYLLFENYTSRDLPALPNSLQILVCKSSDVSVFPDLPLSITNVYITKSRIISVPRLDHLTNLELLDLEDNHIELLTEQLPPNLRTCNLSFNKIHKVCLSSFPATLVNINMAFNWMTHKLDVPRTCSVNQDHMYDETFLRECARLRTNVPTVDTVPTVYNYRNIRQEVIEPTVYTDSQNVHAHSIQDSVSKSVETILNRTKKPIVLSNTYIKDILKLYKSWAFWKSAFWKPVPPIAAWCEGIDIHSRFGITFGELLQRVWTIIESKECNENKKTLHEILKDELNASWGVCFTGRFSRTVNVLNGFIDGVEIGISKPEQMQNQIAQVVKKSCKSSEKKKEIATILDDFGEHNEIIRDSWLDAVDDNDDADDDSDADAPKIIL